MLFYSKMFLSSRQWQKIRQGGFLVNKPAKGKRSKTRSKFKREKKRLTIGKQMAEFRNGANVHIDIDSSVHSGLPDSRYQGLTGTVVGKRGKAFVVDVYQGNALKQIVVTASHLKEAKSMTKEKGAVEKHAEFDKGAVQK